ncbi:MAG: hypothetical protein GYB32_07315 [Algicola sp.]|nr:hypothetical protein [Algicola sp.]
MKLKIAVVAFSLCFFTCKEDAKKTVEFNYKYPSVEQLLDCGDDMDTQLFQEALYSFEADLIAFYTPDQPVYSRAYSLFVSQAINNRIVYQNMVSDHSKAVFQALKQDETLWTTNPDGSHLNYNHPIFKCIGAHIEDEQLHKTFNALIDTNSMSLRMFGDQLRRKTFGMKDDKYLATYVALELYYAKFFDVDFNKEVPDVSETEKQSSNLNTEKDGHEGHNH